MAQPVSGPSEGDQTPKVETQGNQAMNQQTNKGDGLRSSAAATTTLQSSLGQITEALK